eukprot:4135860-Pleurochrysis_carterae.AAC.4
MPPSRTDSPRRPAAGCYSEPKKASGPDVARRREVSRQAGQPAAGRAWLHSSQARAGEGLESPAKVAKLEHVRLGVDEQVLRLDVAVAHAERVDVRQRSAELVCVELRPRANRRARG